MALYYFGNHPHATRADGTKINTRAHYDYICREGIYANMKGKKEDLVFTCSGNLPEWAQDAGKFWDAAEANRRVKGRAYREIRMGLQEELSLDDNIALVEEFLKESRIGKNHAFTYAIHDKEAAYDPDHRNIHCHLMFCEKSIEKDRPLGPDMYFKQYAVNQYGEPCSGYRADRFYHDRHGNITMRKMWADIVNRKFKELGLNQEISEKSLAAQRQDMLDQGRFEEAEKLDRIPAPHLGEAYKNPKVMERIQERVREIDEQTDSVDSDEAGTTATDTTDTEDSVMEQKITCFAIDKVLRRVIKEIEQEEQRIRHEEIMEMEAKLAAEADDEQAEELANEPIVVTANDVYAGLKARAKEQAKKQVEQLAEYKEIKARVIPESLFRHIAIERVVGRDYYNLKKRHQRIQEELKPMEKKYIELKDVRYEQKKEFYLAYSDKLRQKQTMEKQLKAYDEELRNRESDIQHIADELSQQNKTIQEEAKKIYCEVVKAKNQEKMYLAKAAELKENVPDSDTILYSRQLPKLVMRHSKLEGCKPLKDFQILSRNGRAYVVLSDIQAEKLEPKKKTALLLGDTVEKGRASVYMLTMGTDGKEILDVSRTKESVCLYGDAKKTILKRGTENHYLPHAEAVNQQHQTEVLGKINQFLEKAVEDTRSRYQAWWNDEDHSQKKDELKRVEEEMYRGWSM